MNVSKASRRDSKLNRRKNGHRRDGDSVKNIQRLQIKRREQYIKIQRQVKEDVNSV